MALENSDLLVVQRPGTSDLYKLAIGDLPLGDGGGANVIISEDPPPPFLTAEGQLWWCDSDELEGGGRLYIYTGSEWVDISQPGGGSGEGGGASVSVSEDAPVGATEGDLWYSNSTDLEFGGRLYIYIDGVWVDASLPGSGGGGGEGGSSSITVSETPPSAEQGSLWWANSTVDDGGGRLYIYLDGQWVDTSLPGGGGASGDFLSKTEDDTAAGAITFSSRASFHNGLSIANDPAGTSGSHINIEANGTADLFATSGKLIRASLALTGTRDQDLAVFWINPVPSSLTLNGKFSGFSCADLSPTEATVSDTVTGFRSGITAGDGRYAFLATVSPGETAAVSRFDGGIETTELKTSFTVRSPQVYHPDGYETDVSINGILFSEGRNLSANRNGSPLNLSSRNQKYNFLKADGSTGYQINAEAGSAGFVLPADSADAGNYDADGNYEGPVQDLVSMIETLQQEKTDLLATVNNLTQRLAAIESNEIADDAIDTSLLSLVASLTERVAALEGGNN